MGERGVEVPEKRGLGEGVVDTPLVRLFNFLREFLVFVLLVRVRGCAW
jgi:hypothetical protein